MALKNPKSGNIAEELAEETGEPVEKFEPDFEEHPIPELEDLVVIEVDSEQD